jgi:hypothetical protein
MAAFRIILVSWLLVISVYTAFVVNEHGMGLFTVFFGDIAAMGWPGQFNLDFMGFLFLSGLWVAWRHHFSPLGLGLALVAFLGGIPFLTVYLLIVSRQPGCDMKTVMLGAHRAAS